MLFEVDIVYAQTSKDTIALTLKDPFAGRGVAEWNAVEWAESVTSILGVLILIIIFLMVIFDRRIAPPITNFLRFISLCVLPVFLMLFGSFATFEGSKRVEFCQSCHTAMGLYVNDLKDSGSDTLASLHYNNRYIQEGHCYACHVDYGLFGSIQGKMTGLNHLYYWVTGSDTARGEKQIRLYEPYKNELCLRCHAGSKRFLEAEGGIHVDNEKDLLRKDAKGAPILSCLECHGPAHPSLEDKKGMNVGAQAQ